MDFQFTVENFPVIFKKNDKYNQKVQDGHFGFQNGRHRYNFEKVSVELLDLQNICLRHQNDVFVTFTN